MALLPLQLAAWYAATNTRVGDIMRSKNWLLGNLVVLLTISTGCDRTEIATANDICACFSEALDKPSDEMKTATAACNQKSRAVKDALNDDPAKATAIKKATATCMKPLHARMAAMSRDARKSAKMPTTAVKRPRAKRRTGGAK
jgi:hypothetical protein